MRLLSQMPRYLEILLSILLMLALLPLMLCIFLAVKFDSKGAGIHWSKRVGCNSVHFMMPKFRTMRLGVPNVATDRLETPNDYITPVGVLLRRTSLDEIPQLWSVLIGDMSFVGPRPALFNQYELIARRQDLRIDQLKPGVTGWAQVNGRDEISMQEKIELDSWYMEHRSVWLDLKILMMTVWFIIRQEKISH